MVKTCGQNMSITPENLFNILILLDILIQSQWACELGMLNVEEECAPILHTTNWGAGVRELECKWWDIFSSGLTLHLCNKSANGRPGKWFIHQSEGLNLEQWPMRGPLGRDSEWFVTLWWVMEAGDDEHDEGTRSDLSLTSGATHRMPGLSCVSLPVVSEELTCLTWIQSKDPIQCRNVKVFKTGFICLFINSHSFFSLMSRDTVVVILSALVFCPNVPSSQPSRRNQWVQAWPEARVHWAPLPLLVLRLVTPHWLDQNNDDPCVLAIIPHAGGCQFIKIVTWGMESISLRWAINHWRVSPN